MNPEDHQRQIAESTVDVVASRALEALDEGRSPDVYAAAQDELADYMKAEDYAASEMMAIIEWLDREGLSGRDYESPTIDHDYALEAICDHYGTVYEPVERMFYDAISTYVVDHLRIAYGDTRPELFD